MEKEQATESLQQLVKAGKKHLLPMEAVDAPSLDVFKARDLSNLI